MLHMAVRKVIQIGDATLKAKNKEISSFTSINTKKLLRDLKDSMYAAELVGIAAPQIAENFMVFVTHARNTKARNLGKEDEYRVYINPKIANFSKETSVIYEGCGSVINGALFGPVTRSKEIEVQASDEHGKKFSLRCDGILSRVIQHEYDHLMGTEFIQKVDDYSKLLSEDFYHKKIRNSSKQMNASKITKIEYKKHE